MLRKLYADNVLGSDNGSRPNDCRGHAALDSNTEETGSDNTEVSDVRADLGLCNSSPSNSATTVRHGPNAGSSSHDSDLSHPQVQISGTRTLCVMHLDCLGNRTPLVQPLAPGSIHTGPFSRNSQ